MSKPADHVAIDLVAWDAAYRAHAGRLTRMATMLVGPDGAHDLVTETVMSCVRSPAWPSVTERGAYLARALVHSARAQHRRDSARRRRELMVSRSALPRVAHAGRDEDVDRALGTLSPSQLAVVYLLYWEDLTIPAAAEQLGVSAGTVRRQLDRAKRRLRKVIVNDSDR